MCCGGGGGCGNPVTQSLEEQAGLISVTISQVFLPIFRIKNQTKMLLYSFDEKMSNKLWNAKPNELITVLQNNLTHTNILAVQSKI